MVSELRPSSPADAPALRALAEGALRVAPNSPMFTPEVMEWKYWARWRSSDLPRSLVLAREGAIVAHVGVLPVRVLSGRRSLTLLHPFDWMSAPGAVGSGASLLKRLTSLADGVLIVGGSEMTRRMVGPLGFRGLGEVERFAASSDPSSMDEIQGTLSAADPTSLHIRDRVLPPPPWLPFARGPERLRDLLECPAARISVHQAEHGGRTIGGFLLALVPGQARVVASWVTRQSPDDHANLLRLARREAARHPGVAEVVTMAAEPVHVQALLTAGFQRAGSVPMFLSAPPELIQRDARLAFEMLDGDVAFLHHGAPDPWLSARDAP